MMTGLSIGPGMALLILMRWPLLTILITVGSVGTLAWEEGEGIVREAMSRLTLVTPLFAELPTSRVESSPEGMINLGVGLPLKAKTRMEPPTHDPNLRKRAGS